MTATITEPTVVATATPLSAVDTLSVAGDVRAGLQVRATKVVRASDPYLGGHFPELTVYPGVFTIETVSQAVSAAVGLRSGRPVQLYRLHSVRFLRPLLAGDELSVQVRIGAVEPGDAFEVTARCFGPDGTTAAHLKARFRWASGESGDGGESGDDA